MTRRRMAIGGAFVAVVVLALASCGFAGTWPADRITDHSARLRGNIVNSEIGPTSFHFEFGPTDAYGTSTNETTVNVTDVHVPVPVSANLEALAEGTTYHYRLCASDAGGGDCSADRTFTTTSGHDYVVGIGYVPAFGFGPHGGQVDVAAASDGSDPVGSLSGYEADLNFHYQYLTYDITCLRVEGNRATIGLLSYYPGISEIYPRLVYIEDGATTGTPDKWATKVLGGTSEPTCPVPNEADFPPVVLFPSGPAPPGGITIPHEIEANAGYDFVVHDHP